MKNQPKININRKPVSSSQIEGMRDFGSVLRGYSAAKAPFYKKGWFIGSASAVVALIIVGVLLLQKTDKPQLTEAGNVPVAEAEAFIKPALPGVDVKFSSFTIQSGVADTIEVAGGSRIIIPPCPFVDKSGNELKGAVEIKYREMRDAVDFAISGIPMTYDSAGQKYVFESAGMFEIQGYVGGSAIQVNPACPVTVEMVPVVQDGKYNAYYLDTVKKNWEFIGKPVAVRDDVLQPAEQNSETFAGNSASECEAEPIASKDTAWSYTQTFKNGKLIYDSRFSSWYKELKEIENAIEKHRQTAPLAPRKLNPIKNNFRILGDEELYTDIAPFINTIFEVANRDFNTNLFSLSWNYIKIEKVSPWYAFGNQDTSAGGYNETYKIILEKDNSKKRTPSSRKPKERHWWEFWKKRNVEGDFTKSDSTVVTSYEVGDSVKLKPINSSLYYRDISKRRKIKRELIVHPVLTDEEYEAALIVYNEKFKIYNDTLEKLVAQTEVIKERIKAAHVNNPNVDVNTTNTNEEQATGDVLVDATENRRVVSRKTNTPLSDLNYGGIRMQFAASKFGIYNSDYPIRLPSASVVTLNFYDKNKKEQHVDIAYQVITNRNALMCNYYYGCCGKTLKYDSKDENLLFVIFSDGKIGYVNAEDFKKIPKQGSYDITLTISDKSFQSVEEIKAFLGINPPAV